MRYESPAISEVSDAVMFEKTKKYFRYQKQGLEMYEKLWIKPPKFYPQIRYEERGVYEARR